MPRSNAMNIVGRIFTPTGAASLTFRRFALLPDGPALLDLLNVLRRAGHLARGVAHVHRYGADPGRSLERRVRQRRYVTARRDHKAVHDVAHPVRLPVNRLLDAL